ncbi:MAG: hypothetical protein JST54_24135 [Deltaproteobacteria bacterium]|nr:hypothetical protein [Deltaproteobacteria bacterium]
MRIQTLAFVAGTALLVAGCSGSKSGTNGSTGGSGSTGTTGGTCDPTKNPATPCSCTSDAQCAPDQGYVCDTLQTKTCIFQCTKASDCSADFAPDAVRTTCQASSLGCTCDYDPTSQLSVCNTKGCGTDSDCPGTGQVCQDGQCITSPTSGVAACQVFPEYQVLKNGQSATFTVQAYSDLNKTTPVHVPASDVTWSSTSASQLSNAGAKFTANYPSGSPTELAGAVTATVNGKSCTASVKLYADATGGRVVVIDSLAGVPLSGATVLFDSATATTDADGVATVANVSGTTHTVSVFAHHFDYATVAGTTATDLLIPVTRDADQNEGGVKGAMPNLFQQDSKIQAGFVGMSIAGSITDISTALLAGPSKHITGTVAGKSFDTNVPAGVLIGLNGAPFTGAESYTALGAAGWCADSSGNTDTAKVSAGTCGTRGIWALAGEIDIDQLSPIINQVSGSGGLGGLNIGSLLGQLLPVLRNFNSIAVRDVAFPLGPEVSGNVDPSLLVSHDLEYKVGTQGAPTDSVPLGLKVTLTVPTLPKLAGDYVDGAIAVAAVDVPGRGLFPLGLTAGTDTGATSSSPNTGTVTYQDPQTGNNKNGLLINMAPAHGGLESGTYRLAVVAASLKNLTNGLEGSGIVMNPGPCTTGNANGVCYGAAITVPGTFMDFPESATFDYLSRVLTPATGASTLPSGTALGRADFQDGNNHRWFVYFDPASSSITIPTPPAGFDDRTRSDDTATGPRSGLLLLTFDLGSSVTATDAVSFGSNAAGLQKLDKYISRFAIKDYPPPSISITSPSNNSAVSAGASVVVTVSSDSDNANKWTLCWTSSATAVSDISSCAAGGDVDPSSGQATGTLPGNATGAGFLHAVLTTADGTAVLNPTVDTYIQLTVQ